MNLVGLKYPVTSAVTNEIIGYRVIKKQYDLQNSAGVAISLRGNSLILVGYKESENLIKQQNELSKLKRIPFKRSK